MIITEANNYWKSIEALLTAEKLPVSDLPETLDNFIVALEEDEVIGVAGLEIYDDYGLLRSMAVNHSYRGKGIAGELLNHIEKLALKEKLKAIYLLTETAPNYFANKNYSKIARTEVPELVQQSSE